MGLGEVLAACRQYGVKNIDWYGIKVEFGPDPGQPIILQSDMKTQPIGYAVGNPTEDELLYWSADKELPDIEAKDPI